MFLFRFIKYLTFEKTEEWQEAYRNLCEDTDYLYLRKLEQRGFRSTLIAGSLYIIASWWASFQPIFQQFYQMYILSGIFTLLFLLYVLNFYTYIPIEIVETTILSRTQEIRSPSATAKRKLKDRHLEFQHKYYIYTTSDRKKCIDMTDRVLGEDQGYNEEETVYRFSSQNKEFDYVLPKVALEYNSSQKEETE